MGSEATILQWKVIILLFVHLFIDNILFGDSERATSASFVNFGGATCRLYSGFETPITSSGGSNICSDVLVSSPPQVQGH